MPDQVWDPADGPDPNEPENTDDWSVDQWWEWYENLPGPKTISFRRPTVVTLDPYPYL